jgi:hypothetical protein
LDSGPTSRGRETSLPHEREEVHAYQQKNSKIISKINMYRVTRMWDISLTINRPTGPPTEVHMTQFVVVQENLEQGESCIVGPFPTHEAAYAWLVAESEEQATDADITGCDGDSEAYIMDAKDDDDYRMTFVVKALVPPQ